MNRDQGPATRCLHKNLVPANHDQLVLGDTLPPPPAQPANYAVARAEIAKALTAPSKAAPGDSSNGKPYYGALFATLAFQCAASYRDTDKAGGCNGARVGSTCLSHARPMRSVAPHMQACADDAHTLPPVHACRRRAHQVCS